MSVITARAIMLATILEMEPQILEETFSDGTTFQASDTYVRGWLHDAMNWAPRKATRAAHKLPVDWEDQVERSFLQKAYVVKEYDMLPEFHVNSDQTQHLYAPGPKMTWAEKGSSQVEVIGEDEKRAFTVMVSVSADGTLLPFQAIYGGLTSRSCPNSSSPCYNEAIEAGFRFEFSGTKTYWANQKTMRNFVDHILAPYFTRKKEEAGRPPTQKTLWQIDVWSVHRSAEFREWMRKNHPTIIIDYVPGGCTGVAQPCDVGIQRPFKLSTKRSYHQDLVKEIFNQHQNSPEQEKEWKPILIDKRIATLRDRSVCWLWNAFQDVNKKDLIKKVTPRFKRSQNAYFHIHRPLRNVKSAAGTCHGDH